MVLMVKPQEHRDSTIFCHIPILWMAWDQLSLFEIYRKDLLLNGGKVLEIPLGKLLKWNGSNLGVHMMYIISEASPYSFRCLSTLRGYDPLLFEIIHEF